MDALKGVDVLSDFVLNLPFLLIAAGIFFAVFWVQAYFLMYHLTRFGIGPRPKLLAFIFLVGSLVLFAGVISAASAVHISDLVQVVKTYVQQAPLPTY